MTDNPIALTQERLDRLGFLIKNQTRLLEDSRASLDVIVEAIEKVGKGNPDYQRLHGLVQGMEADLRQKEINLEKIREKQDMRMLMNDLAVIAEESTESVEQ